jgi:hypothetical protein
MPAWCLRCESCKQDFVHSEIEQVLFRSLELPKKPEFPPGGLEITCSHCGSAATYQRTDLTYRS